MKSPLIVLGSESPRRQQLLQALGLAFTVEKPTAEEEGACAKTIDEMTCRNAMKKARSITSRLTDPRSIIIGADTLVVKGDEALGKPKDYEAALTMLRKLSGQTHEVVTGLALLSPVFGSRQCAVRTQVTFRLLSDRELESYATTREPYDKAGAYGAQGLGMLFISEIKGSYTNVVGLPLEKLLTELEALTKIPIYQWFR